MFSVYCTYSTTWGTSSLITKISFDTNKTVGDSGFFLDLDSAELKLPTHKDKKIRQDAQKLQKHLPTTARELPWFSHKGHFSSTLVLQMVAEGPHQSHRSEKSGLRSPVSTVTASANRTGVVDHPSFPVEREKHYKTQCPDIVFYNAEVFRPEVLGPYRNNPGT